MSRPDEVSGGTIPAATGETPEDEVLARELCAAIRLAAPVALTRLAGGRNNRVVRADLADGGRVVLKRYHHDPRDKRDRLAAEWAFLSFAAERGIGAVPRPLAASRDHHAALLSFVEGRKLSAGEVTPDHIEQALALVADLNAPPREHTRLGPGSEACFSLADHIATVERRVARLDAIAGDGAPSEIVATARAFVSGRLQPAWRDVRAALEDGARAAHLDLEAMLAAGTACVSPSDFGFHNALVDDSGRATFIDFEYAGRDDPAKLACDFFCQPEVPVPLTAFASFTAKLSRALGLDTGHEARMRLLLDAYRIKWICILLNEFLPVDAARRAFAEPSAREAARRRQLDKATEALATLTAPGPL